MSMSKSKQEKQDHSLETESRSQRPERELIPELYLQEEHDHVGNKFVLTEQQFNQVVDAMLQEIAGVTDNVTRERGKIKRYLTMGVFHHSWNQNANQNNIERWWGSNLAVRYLPTDKRGDRRYWLSYTSTDELKRQKFAEIIQRFGIERQTLTGFSTQIEDGYVADEKTVINTDNTYEALVRMGVIDPEHYSTSKVFAERLVGAVSSDGDNFSWPIEIPGTIFRFTLTTLGQDIQWSEQEVQTEYGTSKRPISNRQVFPGGLIEGLSLYKDAKLQPPRIDVEIGYNLVQVSHLPFGHEDHINQARELLIIFAREVIRIRQEKLQKLQGRNPAETE
jgi:hypothetical protein